ncbi:SRPBCC family protein, partial [Methylorubrum rhodesianum]|uniref:SRPBCC family protein n=1 Tax=Methylorubrum rhodesianum TaxID=29427 RepID=UPI003CFD09B5
YQAWTDPRTIQRWLAPGANVVEQAESDLRVGGHLRLQTRGPDGRQHRISGRYQELEPGRRIVQTWIYDGSSEMRLTHRRIGRADVREAYRQDWPSCFDKLDPVLH